MVGIDLAIGVIPLVVLVFQGYIQVRGFASEYKAFDRTLRSVLRDIATAEFQFKDAIDIILSEVIEEDRRDAMLKDLESGDWQQEDLDEQFRCLLGRQFEPVINSMHGVQETLQEIEKILLPLGSPPENTPPAVKKKPQYNVLAARYSRFRRLLRRLLRRARPLKASLNLQTNPPPQEIQTHSARAKVVSIAKGDRGELIRLRDDLIRHNNSLLAVLQCCSFRKSNAPMLRTPAGAICDLVSRTFPDPRAMQIASKKLYGIVSKQLACNCHLLHLCLGKQAEETHTTKGGDKRSLVPQTNFSFRLTAKSVDGTELNRPGTRRPVLHLVFTNHDLEHAEPSAETPGSKFTACEELVHSDKGYQRYFHESGGGGGNAGFLLRRAATQTLSAVDISVTPIISLSDLVSSQPTILTEYNRYLIAANLACSILTFYSSPWILDWTPQAIQFFERCEHLTSSPALWTPHLALQFGLQDQRQFGVRNREIYSLGLMLLDLGRKQRLEDSPDEEEQYVLSKAFRDLLMKMGRGYTEVVKNCIYVWGDSRMDLMKGRNLDGFLTDINLLEQGVILTTPEPETRRPVSEGGCGPKRVNVTSQFL